MIGLQRGTVTLLPYEPQWKEAVAETIMLLKTILRDVAIDIQHVGSTAIESICAKEYNDLKKKLAVEFADHRENYTAGKHAFIDRVLKEASLWKMSL